MIGFTNWNNLMLLNKCSTAITIHIAKRKACLFQNRITRAKRVLSRRTIITSISEHDNRRTAARAARALLRPAAVGRATFRGGDLRRYVPWGDVGRYVPRARCSGRNCKQFASLSLGCSLAAANRATLRDLHRPPPLRAFVRPHCTTRTRPPSSVAARAHHARRFYICEFTFVKLFTVVKLHL